MSKTGFKEKGRESYSPTLRGRWFANGERNLSFYTYAFSEEVNRRNNIHDMNAIPFSEQGGNRTLKGDNTPRY